MVGPPLSKVDIMEIWKNIKGYKGFYQVSNLGRVRSLDRKVKAIRNKKLEYRRYKGQILKLNLKPAIGYYSVVLQKRGYRDERSVHHIVLETFKQIKPKGKECCHGDGNKTNNKLSNLRWGTRRENAADRIRHGGQRCKLKNKDIPEIRDLKGKLSSRKVGKFFNVNGHAISDIWTGKFWSHVK